MIVTSVIEKVLDFISAEVENCDHERKFLISICCTGNRDLMRKKLKDQNFAVISLWKSTLVTVKIDPDSKMKVQFESPK